MKQIQGVPGGKVNILGGHIIGHSKKKTYMCPTPNGFRGRAISSYSCKIVDKEILRTIFNTGINCSSDNVGTIYLLPYIYFFKFHLQH